MPIYQFFCDECHRGCEGSIKLDALDKTLGVDRKKKKECPFCQKPALRVVVSPPKVIRVN